MEYEIKLTLHAMAQIEETVSYISCILLEQRTAYRWEDFLLRKIFSLKTMPKRYPLIENEPWRSYGIRKMTVNNYNVYYFIKEEKQTVWIITIVSGRRDQINALMTTPM